MKKYLIYILAAFVLASCSSGKKMLEKGQYYDAVVKSVDRLRSSPGNKKARQTLKQAYPLAKDYYLSGIENLRVSNHPFQWSETVYTYNRLNNMYEEIQRSPAAKEIIPNAENYYHLVEGAKQNAAEEQYQAGTAALNNNSRESAKKAYFHFLDADGFVQDYKDVKNKIGQAKYEATLKVVVNQVAVPSRTYNQPAEQFHDKVADFLRRLETSEFVRFYSYSQAKKEGIDYPDQIVKMQFDDFIVGETHTLQQIREVKSDTIKVGEVTLDDGTKKDAMGVVKAKMTVNRMEIISKGILSLEIVKGNGDSRVLLQNFPGEFVWFNEWGNFNGDERALTKEDKLIIKNAQVPPPPPRQLFLEFTKPIYVQLTNRLRGFYKNY
ncbi:MAG: membrane lipoprotein lipid attachment site-containing protein [Cyclobacteriaceae bacterium]